MGFVGAVGDVGAEGAVGEVGWAPMDEGWFCWVELPGSAGACCGTPDWFCWVGPDELSCGGRSGEVGAWAGGVDCGADGSWEGRSRELGWAGESVPAGLSLPEAVLPGSSVVERGWSAGGLVAPLPWSPLLSLLVGDGCWLGGWSPPASGLPVLFGVFESLPGLV